MQITKIRNESKDIAIDLTSIKDYKRILQTTTYQQIR